MMHCPTKIRYNHDDLERLECQHWYQIFLWSRSTSANVDIPIVPENSVYWLYKYLYDSNKQTFIHISWDEKEVCFWLFLLNLLIYSLPHILVEVRPARINLRSSLKLNLQSSLRCNAIASNQCHRNLFVNIANVRVNKKALFPNLHLL